MKQLPQSYPALSDAPTRANGSTKPFALRTNLPSSPSPQKEPANNRLDSWKEIAAYLGREVRTVQRWEKRESLPVHRHFHSRIGSIFAFKSEIDEWRLHRSVRPATPFAEQACVNTTRETPAELVQELLQRNGQQFTRLRGVRKGASPLAMANTLPAIIYIGRDRLVLLQELKPLALGKSNTR